MINFKNYGTQHVGSVATLSLFCIGLLLDHYCYLLSNTELTENILQQIFGSYFTCYLT